MSLSTPPSGAGPLAKREARLAWGLLFPTLTAVSLVVILPLLAIFWISFKPVGLADLRAAEPVVRGDIRGSLEAPGDEGTLRYRIRNSSPDAAITGVVLTDTLPPGLNILELDPRCSVSGRALTCDLGDWEGGFRDQIRMPVTADAAFFDAGGALDRDALSMTGRSTNVLTSLDFTLENFARVFDGDEFWSVLGVTIFYTVFGTVGALLFGLFAAMLLNKS
ncbi:MAG: sugar ABC transporter permease, partial [Pseudomonadota bacterium]